MSKDPSGQFDRFEDGQSTESAPLHAEAFGLKVPLVRGGKGTEDVPWKEVPKVILGHLKTITLGVTGLLHDGVEFGRVALQGLTAHIKARTPLDANYERRVRDTRELVDRDLEQRERRNAEQITSGGTRHKDVLPSPAIDLQKAERARQWIIDLIEKKRQQGWHASLKITDEDQIIITFVREGMDDVAIELAGYTLADAESIIDRDGEAYTDAGQEDESGDEDAFLDEIDDLGDDIDPDVYPHNKEDRD